MCIKSSPLVRELLGVLNICDSNGTMLCHYLFICVFIINTARNLCSFMNYKTVKSHFVRKIVLIVLVVCICCSCLYLLYLLIVFVVLVCC
jgi:hypothetical protein